MNKHNQDGAVNPLLLPVIILVLFLIAAVGFGGWAFSSRQDYKNNSDQKAAAAANAAKQAEDKVKAAQFAEAAKSPYKTYNGPEQFGSIALTYPKTWSAYVSASDQSTPPLDGYFNPDVVSSVTDQNSTFALRLQVVDDSYSSVLSGFNGQEGVTVSPYALPKLPKVVGVKVQGQIEQDKTGTMVVLPDRDKTLEVYTEASTYQDDFNNIILPNLTFAP